jgi:hypothetical protein
MLYWKKLNWETIGKIFRVSMEIREKPEIAWELFA